MRCRRGDDVSLGPRQAIALAGIGRIVLSLPLVQCCSVWSLEAYRMTVPLGAGRVRDDDAARLRKARRKPGPSRRRRQLALRAVGERQTKHSPVRGLSGMPRRPPRCECPLACVFAGQRMNRPRSPLCTSARSPRHRRPGSRAEPVGERAALGVWSRSVGMYHGSDEHQWCEQRRQGPLTGTREAQEDR